MLNMKDVCRTCLRTQKKLIKLYGNHKLIRRIRILSEIEITEEKNFPSKICQECVENINKFYNFRLVLKNCEYELKSRYNFLKLGESRHRKKSIKTNNVYYDSEDEKPLIYIKSELVKKTIEREVVWSENEPVEPDSDYGELNEEDSRQEDIQNSLVEDNNKLDDSESNTDKETRFLVGSRLHPKKYTCSECKLEFTSRFKLYNHKRTIHVVPGVCNICGLVVRADNLRRHVALHSEGPAVCKECGKTFKNSESLRGHMLIHRGHIFTCEKCGKISKVRAEHRRHMKSHLDPEVGKIVCAICGKKVRDLKKHMHSHTGARPHVCSYCGKGFTSPYSLKVHTRQHTNEKPYVCPVCSLAYPQKVSLSNHIKSRHNNVYLEAINSDNFTKNDVKPINEIEFVDNLSYAKTEGKIVY